MKKFEYICNGEKLCIPVAESYSDCLTLAKSDIYRIKGKVPSTLRLLFSTGFDRFHL